MNIERVFSVGDHPLDTSFAPVPTAPAVPPGAHFPLQLSVQFVKSASHWILMTVMHPVGVIVAVLAVLHAVHDV